MINILQKLLGLIYYRTCYLCGQKTENDFVCAKCREKIKYFNPEEYRNDTGCSVYSCCYYYDDIKKIILALKYKRKYYLAEFIGDFMFEYFKTLNLKKDYTVIPVPVHKKRKKERGYNHMEKVADVFSRKTGFPVCKDLILRVKNTQKQYNLKTEERFKNIQNAFEINKKSKKYPLKNDNILILDDIISTGATISEIVKVLKNEGYNNITVLVCASPKLHHINVDEYANSALTLNK